MASFWDDEIELTAAQEAAEAFDEWMGDWLSDLWEEGYEQSLDAQQIEQVA